MRVNLGNVRLFVDFEGTQLRPDGWSWVRPLSIVLLHGGPGIDHLSFRQPGLPFSQLAEFAHLVYVDLRGSGSSDTGDKGTWNLRTWADDVAGLIEVLGLDQPVLLGESAGGFVALELASRHPGLLGGLILENTSAAWSISRVVQAFRRIGDDRAAQVADAYWSNPADPEAFAAYLSVCMPLYTPTWPEAAEPPPFDNPHRIYPERVSYNAEVGAHFACSEMRTFDHVETVKRFDRPVLVLAGELDPICPVEDSDVIAEAAKAATYLRLPRVGHTVAAGAPNIFVAAVREYLELIATHSR